MGRAFNEMKQLTIIAVIIILGFTAIYGAICPNRDLPISYWIWAGITESDAPESNAELYVYQGLIVSQNHKTNYKRLGLYPYPIKSKKLHLVYRISGDLSNAADIVTIFENTVLSWQRHKIKIDGLQLDFDSPTSGLEAYSKFLKQIRETLPSKYALSITGLGDWVVGGDKSAIMSIASTVDNIVFQLYQGRKELPEMNKYLQIFRKYQFPFKIGLLSTSNTSTNHHIVNLKNNCYFRGVIFFIQKGNTR